MRVARLACALFLFAILSLSLAGVGQQKTQPGDNTPAYRNPKLAIQDRVADLLSRMTLEEKVGQIAPSRGQTVHVIDPTGTFTDESASATLNRWWDPDLEFPPKRAATLRNALQRYQMEKTRLGIPQLFMGEALHGFMEYGSTSFPQAIGLASTWDPALVKQVFTAAGDEAGATGIGQVFTPVLDLARDPRWGRTEETYGEDPYLVSRMAVAAVTGLQGDQFFIGRDHVMATMKHFAVHGQPEGGTNTAPGNYSERVIRETFLVPFEAAVKEGHVGSVMASYNEIDGIPSHINHWLLGKVLRQEWGFPGFVTSDGDGLQMLVETHHVAATKADAARLAIAAGVDYDLSDGSVYRTLLEQVRQGIVPEAELDRAVSRILAAKFRLGLFDNPYVDADAAERITNSAEHRKITLKAAQETIVLLKNEKNLLPLDLNKLKTIAVIGPDADQLHLGGYSRNPLHGVSILQGIQDRVGSKAKVVYAEGGRFTNKHQDWHGWFDDNVELIGPATQQDKIKEAVATAKNADVAILVVGENESTNREAWSEQHRGDRDSLDLLGAQSQLVKEVVETGTPTVVLLINGRPLSINYIAQHVPAILEGWYLGEEGGTAAAQVLFGDVNPGGKLPITFPHSVGDLPDFYNHKPSDNRSYAFSTREPLFPFGYGLSYTTFKFDNLHVDPPQIQSSGTAKVSVDVSNTGDREGEEVAQMYVHQRIASITRPVMALKGFQRISLKPGEKRTVEFTITPDALSLLNVDMRKVVEPGAFDIMVGPSSVQTQKLTLNVVGPEGQTGQSVMSQPPAGSESGMVSNFDDLKVSSNYGGWITTSDQMAGGKSTATMKAVEGGAGGSKGALDVSGELIPGAQFTWAGVMFHPGDSPEDAVNLSSKKTISFWAKGDGKAYTIAVLTESNSGEMPQLRPFAAGAEWQHYSLALSDFKTDGHDITGIAFVHSQQPGKFDFQIDQVEVR
ncbi:MAG TPA: CIA30 family protein [Terriglobales bacterium]|nr:CIA30 family protein [Terriglobales bacterium]